MRLAWDPWNARERKRQGREEEGRGGERMLYTGVIYMELKMESLRIKAVLKT
jgi:hypothetical protein